MISAKLIFQQYSGQSYSSSARIKIGNTYYTHYNGNTVTADITSLYSSGSGDLNIDLSMHTSGVYRKFYIPTLQVEYQPIGDEPVRKTFAVENNVSAELDVLSGNATVVFDDITDPVLGVSVSHVYKPNDTIVEYGQNFRTNLDEKLVKTSTTSTGTQYSYTDALGDVHTFKEHFYKIGANGEKVFITSGINSITADADGRLWLNGCEVFRELTTDRGLRASARLDGVVNNAEWVEQRIDEEKQLEEQVKSYKNTLCNFVAVHKETGEITSSMTESKLSSFDSADAFLSEVGCASHLLLSNEEALAYKSLITQRESLNTSWGALTLQKQSLKDSAKSLLLQHNATTTFEYQEASNAVQIESLAHEEENYVILKNEASANEDTRRKNLYRDQIDLIGDTEDNLSDLTRRGLVNHHQNIIIPTQKAEWDAQKDHIISQICNFPGIGAPTGTDGTLTKQYNNVQKQIDIVRKQINDLNLQIILYIDKSAKYIPQFKSYYKEHSNLKNQLATLKMQVPVSYLISDSVVRGFNANGDLVVIQDKYGKYIVIERAKYNTSGKTRVSAVYDQDNRMMRFSYNESNKLSEICNSLGQRAAFRYDSSGYLTAIEHSTQPGLTISYSTIANVKRITRVESTNNTAATLSYSSEGALTKIAHTTTVSNIAHDDVVTGSSSTVSVMNVEYSSLDTKLTYDGIKQEIYKIDPETELVGAHYQLVNGLVTSAEYYAYSDYLLIMTEYADKSCLNRYSYADFEAHMQIETTEEVAYNSFREPTLMVTSKYAIPYTGYLSDQITAEYLYNDDHKLIEKKTTHEFYNNYALLETVVTVEKYHYNNAGELVRKESYVAGEELKTGINIEEYVFNENGIEIQSFTYNSLDPSSKLYTEHQVDENGKTLAAFDESGEHKTAFDYERDGVTVKTERLANGSKFSYGRAEDGTVTAITHSTENGEENSTTQVRTLDMVTEIKSGNNTVTYEYDKKRRVKSVSLNGTDNYVSYAYSGDNTNAEKVTATMADGTVATTTKNAHGNVTKSTCGNRTVTNTYNENQQLTKVVDSVSGQTTLSYDDKGNAISVVAADHSEAFVYDEFKNTLERKTITGNGINQIYTYAYKSTADHALENICIDNNTVSPHVDVLGRNAGKTIAVDENKIAEEKISYIKFGDHATSLPSGVRFATNGLFTGSVQYKYDAMGNIVEVLENGRSACRYEYDALGRLTREDNVAFAKTTTWAYDNNGNILAKYVYALTAKPTSELHLLDCTCKLYAYDDNSDQLMSYDGEEFEYDIIGNPTTYRGKTATWAYGRQLTAFDGITFSYDARGRRTAKNGITFIYDSNGNLIKQSNGLEFLYDHTGVFAVKCDGSTYFYRKNAQQDVIALLDSSGAVVAKYKYDAWGNCEIDASTTDNELANLNPFRYRSYYYDPETNLYFLKTRYYDPEIGRFMTIDDLSYLDPDTINGLNLYAYCGDNPVMYNDPNGTLKWYHWLGIIGAVIVIAAATVLTLGAAGIAVGGAGLAGAVIHGAAVGALVGAGIGIAGGAIAGGIYSAVTGADFWSSVGAGALAGLGIGAVVGAIIGGFVGANGWYNARALEFTNLGTNDEVVLGKYIRNSPHSYDAVATNRGSTYYGTTQARWTEVFEMFGVKEKGMWKINKAFLKQQIKAGKKFAITNDYIFGYLFDEVSYITSKGISLFLI